MALLLIACLAPRVHAIGVTRAMRGSSAPARARTHMTSDGEAALLAMFDPSSRRGSALDVEARARIDDLAQELESSSDIETSDSELLPGRWRVLYQGTRGVPVSPTSIDAWREYLGGDGPSPIQNLVSGSSSVDRLYQIIDGRRFLNVVDFSPAGCLAIEARLEGKPSRNRLAFRFTGGRILLRAVWNGAISPMCRRMPRSRTPAQYCHDLGRHARSAVPGAV